MYIPKGIWHSIYYSQDWKSQSAFGFYKQFSSTTHDAAKHFLCRSTFLIYFSKFTALSVAKSSLSPSLHQWRIALWITHFFLTPVPVKLLQSCPALSDPMDHSAPGSSIYGSLQARILEWVASPFSRGSFRCRDRTRVSCIAGKFFIIWATREALILMSMVPLNVNAFFIHGTSISM